MGVPLTAPKARAPLACVGGVTLSHAGPLSLFPGQEVILMNSGNKAALLHPIPRWCPYIPSPERRPGATLALAVLPRDIAAK